MLTKARINLALSLLVAIHAHGQTVTIFAKTLNDGQASEASPFTSDKVIYVNDGNWLAVNATGPGIIHGGHSLNLDISRGGMRIDYIRASMPKVGDATTLYAGCRGNRKFCFPTNFTASTKTGPVTLVATSTGILPHKNIWSRAVTVTFVPVSYFGGNPTAATTCDGNPNATLIAAHPIFVFKNDVNPVDVGNFYAKYTYVGPNPANIGELPCNNMPSVSAYYGPIAVSDHSPNARLDPAMQTPPITSFPLIPEIGIWQVEAMSTVSPTTVWCKRAMSGPGDGTAFLNENNPLSLSEPPLPNTPIGGNC